MAIGGRLTHTGKGIGRATCAAFAVSGVKGLVLSGRNEGDLKNAAEEAKSCASNPEFDTLIIVADIGVEADIIRMINQGVAHFGRIDYAVNNAGVSLSTNLQSDIHVILILC
jgi:NAD(P)-dependent dehydrogenase (short-subunit alcohol dehydrogenase family)